MKKTSMYVFGLAAAILSAACTDENELNSGFGNEGIVFTTSISSRATDTSFEAGDQIGISMIAGGQTLASNVQYSTEDGTGFSSATPLTYEQAAGVANVTFAGVYPYKESSVTGNVYSFTLSTSAGTSLTNNDVMYAVNTTQVGTEDVPLNFTHKLVKVVMQLKDEEGNPINDATLTIDNQQVAGTLNLTDGTVTATDGAASTMYFAANASIPGEYQTIVMPSEALDGRCIKIVKGENTYSCPVGDYKFEAGKKLLFSATIGEDVTVEPGKEVSVVPSITDWLDVRIEAGWILSGAIDVLGKDSKQLASNVALTNQGATIDFEGTLKESDVYSLSYSRGSDVSKTDFPEATITIAPAGGGVGKDYTLPAGQASGKLLIPVGENVHGILVSTETGGITLTDVTVYTNEAISLPVVLWEGNATANAEWPNDITNFTIAEADRALLVPGATLKIYGEKANPEDENFEIKYNYYFYNNENENGYPTDGPGICDRYNYESHGDYISVPLLTPVIEAIEKNNYIVGLVGKNCRITRIELEPAPAGESATGLLWKGTSLGLYSEWSFINFWLPAEVTVGSTIRISFQPLDNGGKVSGAVLTWNNEKGKNDQNVVLPLQTFDAGATYVDYNVDESLYQTLVENGLIGGNTPVAVMGGTGSDGDGAYCGVVITQVELIPAN